MPVAHDGEGVILEAEVAVAIRRFGQTDGVLATADVPSLLPGRLAQIALDLPPGTQPEREARYTLFADEARLTGDVVTNNNRATFAVILTPDSDGDGMPDSWEIAYGLNPNDPRDAGLDRDGDGLGSDEGVWIKRGHANEQRKIF